MVRTLTLVGVLLVPLPSMAQTEAAPIEVTEPSAVDLISEVGRVVDDWRNLGWLAGVIALINLLLNLLRYAPIDTWLERLDAKWVKPLLATLLGAALGGFSTFETGAGVVNSVVAGMLAGLGSVGFHELVDNLRRRSRRPVPKYNNRA